MTFFSKENLNLLNAEKIPHHVAIIPDGNRRWAKDQKTEVKEGHREGGHTLIDIVKGAKELGIKILTFYLFSTENWNRPQEEIDALMWLFDEFLIDQRETILKNEIRLETIGDLSRLPLSTQKLLQETKELTAHLEGILMVFALNYGGKDEIRRSAIKIAQAVKLGTLDPSSITEEVFASYLDTRAWQDPDLLIRTSGEMRISNYLLWQISYSEIYISETLWPNFTPHDLLLALLDYQKRQRRLGGNV